MPTEWYYLTPEGKPMGPVTPTELKRIAQSGQISRDTLVRKGLDGKWLPTSKIKGLLNDEPAIKEVNTQKKAGPASNTKQHHSESGDDSHQLTIRQAADEEADYSTQTEQDQSKSRTLLLGIAIGLFISGIAVVVVLLSGTNNTSDRLKTLSTTGTDNDQSVSTSPREPKDNALTQRDKSKDEPSQQEPISPKTDPEQELRQVAERGRQKAPQDDEILQDVSVDVKKTSSLVYPYVGRIISIWGYKADDRSVDKICIYYKYQNGKWVPTWFNRGGSRVSFGILTEEEALRTPSLPQMAYPWTNAHAKFTIWIP
jgi:hypothetical protein